MQAYLLAGEVPCFDTVVLFRKIIMPQRQTDQKMGPEQKAHRIVVSFTRSNSALYFFASEARHARK